MTTAVQTRQTAATLRDFLTRDDVRGQIAMALPRHLGVERIIRQSMTLVQTTPGLLECSQVSILKGILLAGQLGLELSGPLGQAYLVPRSKEACFQIGYRGVINLAFRSDKILEFPLETVCKNDKFKIYRGTDRRIEHEADDAGDRGPTVGFYAAARMVNGGRDFEFMTVAQCVDHRDKYASDKRVGKGLWWTNFPQMSKKTCAMALGKRLPMSVEFQMAVAADAGQDVGNRLQDRPPIPRANGDILPRGTISDGQRKLLCMLWESLDYSWERLHAELEGSALWGYTSRTQFSQQEAGYVIDHLLRLAADGEDVTHHAPAQQPPAQIGIGNGHSTPPSQVQRDLDAIAALLQQLGYTEEDTQDLLTTEYHKGRVDDLSHDERKGLLELLGDRVRQAEAQAQEEERREREGIEAGEAGW